ncbi:hypothetical protein [Pseudalkalibacillus salsuginis]|uniref:hypothetical protein n=1 Tax=Pseudalkalibacillus salsuginis TaxID=2910972 RepID=UPI001F38BB2F|nr:hypothetical protein [Pseudalkalibacillus salsuginis]MCF6410696.1 hypothetical protein [Pseudalkalibacillus salsuginis]
MTKRESKSEITKSNNVNMGTTKTEDPNLGCARQRSFMGGLGNGTGIVQVSWGKVLLPTVQNP